MHDAVPEDLVDIAVQTYNLSRAMGGADVEALREALNASMEVYESQVLGRAAEMIASFAGAKPPEIAYEIKCIIDFLREQAAVPQQSHYRAHEGDLVEVVLRGNVHVTRDVCQHCGKGLGVIWSVNDHGLEYLFDDGEVSQCGLDIRVLRRSK